MRRIIAPLVLLIALLASVRIAAAQDAKAQAKQHFQAGESLFKGGNYRGAIVEFEAADGLVPSPILSYNIALCHEKLGEDEQAVARYREYLARRPDAQNRAQVEQKITAAEARIAAKTAPPPKVEAPPPPKVEAPPPPPKVEAPPPKVEGPAPPPPQVEGPGAPLASGGPADEALVKRLPNRSAPPEGRMAQAAQPPAGMGAGSAVPAGAPPSDQKKKVKPVYKEWWFWAVVVVSAVIVVDVLSSDGSSTQSGAPSGAILLRF